MSQLDMILADLKRGKRITPLDALHDYGCLRLGARIWDLKDMGHPIECEMITTPYSKKKVACYYMKIAPTMKAGEQAAMFAR